MQIGPAQFRLIKHCLQNFIHNQTLERTYTLNTVITKYTGITLFYHIGEYY